MEISEHKKWKLGYLLLELGKTWIECVESEESDESDEDLSDGTGS